MDAAEIDELACLVRKCGGLAENDGGTVDAADLACTLIGPNCLFYGASDAPAALIGDRLFVPHGDPDINGTIATLLAEWALRELADWHDDPVTTRELAHAVATALLIEERADHTEATSQVRLQTVMPHRQVS